MYGSSRIDASLFTRIERTWLPDPSRRPSGSSIAAPSTKKNLTRCPPDSPTLLLSLFQQLNAIAERIAYVHPLDSLERFVRHSRKSSSLAACDEIGKAPDEQRGVGFARWMKVRIHPEVQSQRSSAEPRTAAAGEVGRLG